MIHVDVLETNRVNIFQHFVREEGFEWPIANQISNHDVLEAGPLLLIDDNSFVIHPKHFPQTSLTPWTYAQFSVQNSVPFNHLAKDVFEFIISCE